MFFAFVVDTSASMCQISPEGLSMLDICKAAVENFCRTRSRVAAARADRYFLISSEQIEIGWRDSPAQFVQKVRNLRVSGLTNLVQSIHDAFNLLNKHRHRSPAIDNYGQGLVPWCCEPSAVIVLSDGGQLCTEEGVINNIELSHGSIAGSELTREPFRWDQRVFTAILRFGQQQNKLRHPIAAFSEYTAGKCEVFASLRSLNGWMDFLATRLTPAVVCRFTPVPPAAPNVRTALAVLLVNSDKGNWPFPEQFLPEHSQKHLPARHALPLLSYTRDSQEAILREDFPFDKYDIEPGSLTAAFMESKCPSWTIYSQTLGVDKGKHAAGRPFGILKANVKGGTLISLYILPYNFPKLFSILDDAKAAKTKKQTDAWRSALSHYFKKVPFYYGPAVRAAFQRSNLHNLVPEVIESYGGLSLQVRQYLEHLRVQSKRESEMDMLASQEKSDQKKAMDLKESVFLPAPTNQIVSIPEGSLSLDPSSIPRCHLLYWLGRMRNSVVASAGTIDDEAKHSLPVAQMGNYHATLMNKEIPRDPFSDDENSNRKVNFGNRYRRSKSPNRFALLAVDEADAESDSTPGSPQVRDKIKLKIQRVADAAAKKPIESPKKTRTSPAIEIERRQFWTENKVGDLFWQFTRLLQSKSSDLSSVEFKLKALDGKKRFISDLLALLRRQAGEYHNVEAQKWIDTLNFK